MHCVKEFSNKSFHKKTDENQKVLYIQKQKEWTMESVQKTWLYTYVCKYIPYNTV